MLPRMTVVTVQATDAQHYVDSRHSACLDVDPTGDSTGSAVVRVHVPPLNAVTVPVATCSARGLPLSSALLLPSERSCADLSGMCLTVTVPQLHMRCWPVHRQVVRLGSRLGSCPWRLCVQVASLLPVHLFLARSDASLNGGNYGNYGKPSSSAGNRRSPATGGTLAGSTLAGRAPQLAPQ